MYVIDNVNNTHIISTWANTEASRELATSGELGVILYEDEVEKGYDGLMYAKGHAPAPPSLSCLAAKLSMSKTDFVYMVEAMTTSFALVDPSITPITFEVIWAWCQSDMKLMQLFITENTVHRADPMLDSTTGKFAPQFAHFLDLMFVEHSAIMTEIEKAKTENRPMNLTDIMIKWNINH